ncbi:MAG: effector-associated constant component EACC1 [Planctomycetota bacterium]
MGQTFELMLHVNVEPEDGAEELAELGRQLRTDLLELDVENVDFVRADETPEGTKTGTPIDWTTLLLTVAASGGVLTTLINVLQAWLTRQDRKSLSLEIDGDKLTVTGISSKEQKRLIDAWLSRHRGFVIADE